ncbi:MAG: ribosome silencing factor, partial [Sedimentisphaerales bacterium]|nr:ribosome silencing factor [Sedimentisphaerales bacterium]
MTKKKENQDDDRSFALAIAKNALDRHCTDVVVVDLHDKSPATDYFVIATTTSPRQARSIADESHEIAKSHGHKRFGLAGYDTARWILIDYVNVVIHLFDAEYREYYDLELLWGDAERLK